MGRVMAVTALLAAIILGGCATQPLPQTASFSVMPAARRTAPTPAGFISFCLRYPDQCQFKAGTPAVVTLTEHTWQTLAQVNRTVNNAIWPMDDLAHYGRAEYWTIPTDGYGVCHTYAVTKRKELSDAGLPLAALRLAVVYSERSGRHAVLTVATDKGDFVLDNLSYDIVPWDAAGYTWIERQDGADPFRWVSLQPNGMEPSSGVLTAANVPAAGQDLRTAVVQTASSAPAQVMIP